MISFTPFDPTFLIIGPLRFRYYGLMYVIAFFLCYFFLKWAIRRKLLQMSIENLWDLLFYGTLGVILGGRIGYIFFYNFPYFMENPGKIIAVWEGGLSFHGGLIGAIIAGLIYCKVKKKSFYQIADLLVIPLALGIAFAKLGNFINGELFGRPTTVPWGMYFEKTGNDTLRHPSQLYELLKNIVILIILIFSLRYKLPKGVRFWLFITLYGFIRFFIEFVREPDPQLGLFFGWMSMGQILCAPMAIIGAFMVGWLMRKRTLGILDFRF